MSDPISNDPRAIRTREAFHNTFKALLQEKPYHKITVKDISKRAGFARHTFYNHYETKDDILNDLVDSVLVGFISSIENMNLFKNKFEELKMLTSFFQVWKDNPDLVNILNKVDIDVLLIERLKIFFTKFYYERVIMEIPGVTDELAKYVISFNAYSLLGILKPWLNDGMKHSPEVMAGFLMQLVSSSQRIKAVEIFMSTIR
jgi:AcrR family transcriptional regulator